MSVISAETLIEKFKIKQTNVDVDINHAIARPTMIKSDLPEHVPTLYIYTKIVAIIGIDKDFSEMCN